MEGPVLPPVRRAGDAATARLGTSGALDDEAAPAGCSSWPAGTSAIRHTCRHRARVMLQQAELDRDDRKTEYGGVVEAVSDAAGKS